MFKKLATITAIATITALSLTGCSDSNESKFEGTWVTGENGTIPMEATIDGDTVEVYLTDGSNSAIHWSGDLGEVTENGDSLSVNSNVDPEALAGAIFASDQETKTFVLEGDILSFQYDVTGITQEVELVRE